MDLRLKLDAKMFKDLLLYNLHDVKNICCGCCAGIYNEIGMFLGNLCTTY
jgi:hypothetical protein